MKITWKSNPLATVVELDEHDRQLLRLRLKIETLEDSMFSAYYCLNPSDRKAGQSLEDAVKDALQRLDMPYVLGDVKRGGRSFDAWLDARVTYYERYLAGVHEGDCTCVACSCCKCHAEDLVGTNTTEGLGKHEGSKLSGAFNPKEGGTEPTIDEVIAKLSDYLPVKGPTWANYSDEEFQRHVPRWTEEAKNAHAWLVAYKSRTGL